MDVVGSSTPSSDEQAALLPPPAIAGPRRTAVKARRVHTPSYLYPLRGIVYLFQHPVLWRVIGPRIIPCLVLSFAIIFILFFSFYLPLVAFLAVFHGPLAFVQAALIVLNVSATLISILCENFLLEESLVNMFDAVLLLNDHKELVDEGQEVDPLARDVVASLGKYKKSPNLRASFRVICEYVFFLWMNFVPLVGPPIFLAIQGNRAGPIAHYWYFRLKGWDKKKRRSFVKARHWEYLGFGTMALALQIVPVVSIIVAFTNAIGAALWAMRMEYREKKRRLETEGVEGLQSSLP